MLHLCIRIYSKQLRAEDLGAEKRHRKKRKTVDNKADL